MGYTVFKEKTSKRKAQMVIDQFYECLHKTENEILSRMKSFTVTRRTCQI